ncbi:lysophospholipid acyltransferase family protein [Roseomonas elaeocarpi]|uniref:Lysophospholipid acyltransferase family protein n=1 Tax=Roseomonas elaeocarpi TaxID=907779 RepID=A0ABV6JZZ1_9PROT
MLKALLRHPTTLAAAAHLIGLYLAFVYATTRWTWLGVPAITATAESGQPFIVSFWHERLPMMPMLWRLARGRFPALRPKRAHVLVSRHRDGRFIGDIIGRFQLDTVHGSTSRGGAAGMVALLRLLEAGDLGAITPDGPRGPRRQAAAGVAQIAATAGVPVIPCAASTTRRRVLRSWDRMVLPLPFGRGVVVVCPPVTVRRDEVEAGLAAITAGMNEACALADRWVAAGGRDAA